RQPCRGRAVGPRAGCPAKIAWLAWRQRASWCVRFKSSLASFQQHVLPALVCFALVLLLAQARWFQRFENVTFDARASLRARYFRTAPRDDIVLVGIDQTSLSNPNFGVWPWRRSLHGNFMQ